MVYEVLGARTLSRTSILHLERRHLVASDRTAFTREVVVHPGAVAVVPMLGDQVVLYEQHRVPAGRSLIELPAGKLDVAGEPPEVAARRECEEEVGYRPGRMEPLIGFYTAPGFSDEWIQVYLATDLEPVPARPDGIEEETARVLTMPLREALDTIASGGIVDCKTIAGLYAAAARTIG